MKMLTKLVAMLFLAYWLLLSHVSLTFLDKNASISEVSKDGKYKVFLKDMNPINPIGLYCLLTTESPIYFVLYSASGSYIGQSSPFTCYGKWSDVPFRFPGEEFTTDENSFVVFDDEYHGELNISTVKKKWWSTLLAPFS